MAESFKIEDVILAGNRGVLAPKRIEAVNRVGFKTLTALTHPEIKALMEMLSKMIPKIKVLQNSSIDITCMVAYLKCIFSSNITIYIYLIAG